MTSRVLFQYVGSGFQKVGLAFLKVGLAFLKVGLAYQKVGLAYQKVGLAFLKVGLAYQKVGLAFLKVGLAYQKVGSAYQNVGLALQQVGLALQNSRVGLQNSRVALQNSRSRFQNPVGTYMPFTNSMTFCQTIRSCSHEGFAQKVRVVSGPEFHTKSELGAIATSRTLTFQKLERRFRPHFHELTLRLVAIAPSSDFVLPDNSIPQQWIRLFVQSQSQAFVTCHSSLVTEFVFSGQATYRPYPSACLPQCK